MNAAQYAENLRSMIDGGESAPTVLVQAHQVTGAENRRMLAERGMNIKAASFDNQFTTEDNRELWSLANGLSVDAQANAGVRRTLRMRGQYAYHSNPFVMGAANRLAKYVIGSGPKLHMATSDKNANRLVEKAFAKWAKAVRLPRKFRTLRAARFYNGEGFLILRTNPKLKHAVKLDLFEVEADQVTSPLSGAYPAQYPDQQFDGVTLDPWGNPDVYHVLRQHPGAMGAFLVLGYEADPLPAQYVLHDYAHLRPGQQRGIPEVTPAADIFEEARRYRRSVVAAAETASDHAGWIETQAPTNTNVDADTGWGHEMDYVNVRRRTMGVLPGGAKAYQMKAEQPVTTYDTFMMSLMVEAGQVLDMPLFILTGDARLANMSSAYVATQSFIKSCGTDREEYDAPLDRTFEEWLAEARRIPGLIPPSLEDDPDHAWRWDRISTHADPQKMSQAQNQRLKNGRSPSLEFADDGTDFDEQVERAASDYGVPVAEFKAALFQSVFAERGTPPPASTDPETGDEPEEPDDEDQE